MPTFYRGLAANIESIPTPPTASPAIASSTNASPIVITTTGAHNIATGDEFIVNDHLVNTAANGIWVAGAVTSNSVALVGSTGNGVGAATGTVHSMAIGAIFPIPADNDDEDAASVNVSLEELADRTSFLWAKMGWKQHIYKGGKLTVDTGGSIEVDTGATLALDSGSTLNLNSGSRIEFPDIYRPADSATVSFSMDLGDTVILPSPAAVHTLSLLTTTGTLPKRGERVLIALDGACPDGLAWHVKREDGTLICDLWGYTISSASAPFTSGGGPITGADIPGQISWAECQFDGVRWRGRRWGGVFIPGGGW